MRSPAVMFLLVIGLCITSTQVRSDPETPSTEARPAGEKLEEGTSSAETESPELRAIVALAGASRSLRELASEPVPDELSAEERRAVEAHNGWLERRSRDLDALAKRWRQALTAGETSDPSLSREHRELQQQLQRESRQFASESELVRTRYDAARAAIDNIR